MHPPRVEDGATLAATSTQVDSITPVAQAQAPAAADGGLPSATGLGLILFLGAALIGLGFAAIPMDTLAAISGRLAESRQDIGLALALMISLTAAVFVLLIAT